MKLRNWVVIIVVSFGLLLVGFFVFPAQAISPKLWINQDASGILHIVHTQKSSANYHFTWSPKGLVISHDLSEPYPICHNIMCVAGEQIFLPSETLTAEIIRFRSGENTLSFSLPHPNQDIELKQKNNTITLISTGNLQLASAYVAGQLTARVADTLVLSNSQLNIEGDLTLIANALRIRDSKTHPTILQAGGKLELQGDQSIDIFSLAHPDSALISGGNMVLRSKNTVKGDAHYLSGGEFRVENLQGQAGHLVSPFDPIILANNRVSLGNYTGASLHILAGDSVTLGTIVITGTDTTANTINSGNTSTFNGTNKISALYKIGLSNGSTVTVNGNVQPTLDVRAGVNWSTFSGGSPSPANQVIPPGVVSPVFGSSDRSAAINVGDITISQPEGFVLLTNQYLPNRASGHISTGNIDVSTTISNTNAGSIVVDSRGNISTGALDSSAVVSGSLVTVGNGGPITLLAPAGSINTSGDVTTFARVPVNNSGTVGNGGSVLVAAASEASINSGTGTIDAFAFANSSGNAGNGGNITVSGTSFGASRLYAHSFAGSGGSTGNGGTISVNATNGVVDINTGSGTVSIQTNAFDFNTTAGDAGQVTIVATDGISVSHGINAQANGANSDGGDITLTTNNGNISTGFLYTFVNNNTTPGNAGNVSVQALNGGITTSDIGAYSKAFVINNPSQNGGNVTLQALNGSASTGQVQTYSEARGLLGNTGNGGTIDINAVNGGITANGTLQSYARSSINNSNSSDAGIGGNITLQATGNISVAGNLDAYSLSDIFGSNPVAATSGNGGNISVTSTDGNVDIGDISSYSSAQSLTGNGGNISISAITGINVNNGSGTLKSYTSAFTDTASAGNAGNVTLNTGIGNLQLKQIASSATAQFSNNAGNGGDITLNTGNGNIDINGTFFYALSSRVGAGNIAGDAGDIVLNATQGINIDGRVTADVHGKDGNAGHITMTTTSNNINVSDPIGASALYNTVGSPGNGGNVLIQALNGSTVISDVTTYSLSLLIHNDTHDGGNITLQALNGDVTFGDLLAYSEARGAQGDTGNAGQIVVTTTNGSISGDLVRADSRSAINNNGSGIVGNGNNVTMQATNAITLSDGLLTASAAINTSTGQASPVGSSNSAGNVTLSANNIELSYVDARSVSPTTIGTGGTVQITAGQFFKGTGNLFGNSTTIDSSGLSGSGAITITHGGNGITPFIVDNTAINGTSGAISSADATITPTNSYLYTYYETPNIWIISVPFPFTMSHSAAPTNTNVEYQSEITYTIVLSNPSTVDADNVFLTVTLPGNVDFVRWVVQPTPLPNVVAGKVTWNGSILANQAIIFSYVVAHTGDYGDVLDNIVELFHPESLSLNANSLVVTIENNHSVFVPIILKYTQ